MKRTTLALIALCAFHSAQAMQQPLALAQEENSIVHDFLYNPARFKVLWGTPEKGGTNYHKLPKEISQRIAREALAPAVAMLQRNICLLIATRTIPKTFMLEPLSYNSRQAWNYFELHRSNPSECPSVIEGHPQTKLAVTVSPDHSVNVWNTQTKQSVQILQGHTALINRAQFDPSGNLIATTSEDKTVKLWNVHSGECMSTFGAFSTIPQSRSLKGGAALAIIYANVVKIYDVKTGKVLRTIIGDGRNFHSIAFNDEESHFIDLFQQETDESFGHKANELYARIRDIEQKKYYKAIKTSYCQDLDISDNTILIRTGKKHVNLWDVGRYFAALKFFDSANLEQALLLNCIAHTLLINKILQKKHMHKSEEFKMKLIRWFDFNQFPHLQPIFESLPLEIQHGLHESVILRDEDDGWCSIA